MKARPNYLNWNLAKHIPAGDKQNDGPCPSSTGTHSLPAAQAST